MKKIILNISLLIFVSSCMESPTAVGISDVQILHTETKFKIVNAIQNKVYVKEYSPQGNILKYLRFEENNVKQVSEFEYDGGTQIETITDENENSIRTVEYKVNDNGKVDEVSTYDVLGNVLGSKLYEYDEYGRVIKLISSDTNSVDNILTYNYDTDKNGRVNLISIVNDKNETIKYDSLVYSNNQITKFTIDQKGEIEQVISLLYDPSGKIESETILNGKNEITCKFIYRYTFY
ncbi:hypothetical protein OAQ99_06735 [Candidatus Kapabacteria bacterium]|nr:hypothetical protein [Candidatus Kapabacteria bacterium]